MTRLWRFRFAAVLACSVILAAGCASAPKPAGDAPATPPKLLVSSRPELRFSPRTPGRPVDIRVEVQIDANGRPNIETLKVTGQGAVDNRDAVATWLQSAQFQPAQRAGHAVPGTFKTRFRVEVHRTL